MTETDPQHVPLHVVQPAMVVEVPFRLQHVMTPQSRVTPQSQVPKGSTEYKPKTMQLPSVRHA